MFGAPDSDVREEQFADTSDAMWLWQVSQFARV